MDSSQNKTLLLVRRIDQLINKPEYSAIKDSMSRIELYKQQLENESKALSHLLESDPSYLELKNLYVKLGETVIH